MTSFGVRLCKSLFEMFQGTFVCVSLECEQCCVSCVIYLGDVERFFRFVAHCLLNGTSWETSSLSKFKATLAHGRVRKFGCFCRSVVRSSSTCLLKKNIVTLVLTMSSFFTFYTDESMCAMRSALLVPIQMWK